jgi:hypothetical protein
MKSLQVNNLRRITKATARKLYNNHQPVVIIPCKCHPGSAWFTGLEFENDGSAFDTLVNSFIYYNCNDAQLGKYPAFYEVMR